MVANRGVGGRFWGQKLGARQKLPTVSKQFSAHLYTCSEGAEETERSKHRNKRPSTFINTCDSWGFRHSCRSSFVSVALVHCASNPQTDFFLSFIVQQGCYCLLSCLCFCSLLSFLLNHTALPFCISAMSRKQPSKQNQLSFPKS